MNDANTPEGVGQARYGEVGQQPLVSPERPPIIGSSHGAWWERSEYPHCRMVRLNHHGCLPDKGWKRVEANGQISGFVADGCKCLTTTLEENEKKKAKHKRDN